MDLRNSGFSLWCDFIERNFLNTEFKNLITSNIIYGATSNPSIFANAILKSDAYRADIEKLRDKKAKDIYENLAFSDIKNAAHLLLPLWEKNKNDGFISIEIDPMLCDDATKSIDEGKRIFKTIGFPNVMIKVPATNAGFEVMNELYKSSINVNATLVFSTKQTKLALESFGKTTSTNAPKAVISIFVSRFDRALEDINKTKDSTPKLGIYNAINCYNLIESFANPNIRTLFASTGVKDSFIDSSYYINSLLFKNSINTAPLDTIKDFIKRDSKIIIPESNINDYLHNIDVDSMSKILLDDGLKSFIKSFEDMLGAI
ncbi:transaldolase [Helicobacter sp. 16-1353]|uniref:transaldolase n=1 Tax=Helicobacter sp. 16-1353 TaxID=2004996 RepID=UPI000DCD2D8E|nr:transaldolase [Helicobacter sp. 16-1353]RAX54450.1 transaldolase [Helicobacter sp. 16-1353]